MGDAYHPYVQEELPLNIPANKRREREIEAHSYEATRPATIPALNESLLSSFETNYGSTEEDENDYFGSDDVKPEDDSPTSPLRIYDDKHRPSTSQFKPSSIDEGSSSSINEDTEFIDEKNLSSSDRRKLPSVPALFTPHNTTELGDSFTRVPNMAIPTQDKGTKSTEDCSVNTIGPTSSVAMNSSSRFKRDALESHALGLNNLLSLKARRKMRLGWRESSCDVMLFVEEEDDDYGVVEESSVDRKHQHIPLPFGSSKEIIVDKSKSNNSVKKSLDETVPVEIATIKQMEKEDYWNLFERILHMPHDFVPEDHMGQPLEFIKRRNLARRSRAAAQAQTPKPKKKRNRPRRRKSFDYQMKTSRNDEVSEPTGHRPKRRSSFGGSTGQEKEIQPHNINGQGLLSKLPFMNVRFVRPKKPDFVAMMEGKTQELGRKAREATHLISSKFHAKKIRE